MPTREQPYFAAICNNDENAFEALFTRHYMSLVHFAASFIPAGKEDAKDIVAEVFGHLWTNRHQLVLHGSLTAYLYTSVRNKTIDYLRKNKLSPVVLCDSFDNLPVVSSDTADKNQAYKETRQRIAVLVDQLPAQARLIFKMNRDEGLAYEEIAAILQVSVNTVKTQMYRSLRFLKEQYAAFCG
jgi:RNA polymerase sigma-70 factor (ECF subfamily)